MAGTISSMVYATTWAAFRSVHSYHQASSARWQNTGPRNSGALANSLRNKYPSLLRRGPIHPCHILGVRVVFPLTNDTGLYANPTESRTGETFMDVNVMVLFVHIVGVLLLFVSLGMEWVGIDALSRSPTPSRAEPWARMIAGRSLRLQGVAAVLIFASGARIAARFGMFEFAWVRASLGALVLIAALAGIVSRSRRRTADSRIGRLWPASVAIRIALALGVVYLMVAKSDTVESLIVLALALALGAVAATRMKRAIRVSYGQ